MLLLAVALSAFVADRLTKLAVQRYLPVGDKHPLLGGVVVLNHTQNAGAAFSLLPALGNVFLAFAAVAVVIIVYAYRRVPNGEVWSRVALGLILGGAIGNAFDRLLASSVTDFIDLRFWPVFNIADSCIVVGAAILIWRLSRLERARA